MQTGVYEYEVDCMTEIDGCAALHCNTRSIEFALWFCISSRQLGFIGWKAPRRPPCGLLTSHTV